MGWMLLFYLLFYIKPILSKSVYQDNKSLAKLVHNIDNVVKKTEKVKNEIKVKKGLVPINFNKQSAFDIISSINKKTIQSDKKFIESDIHIDGNAYKEFKRTAQRDRRYLWHEKVVPYVIDKSSLGDQNIIIESMNNIANVSCLTFVPYNGQTHWINFVKQKGCWSSVGKLWYRPGSQDISIGDGCLFKHVIIHEIMHALGFQHEHKRNDRNDYVEIMWENINPDELNNFEKESKEDSDDLGVEYDFESILHYGSYDFSKNGKTLKTIVRLVNPELPVGGSIRLSEKDILKLNVLYSCKSDTTEFISEWSSFGPCNSLCYKSRQRFCSSSDILKCPFVDEDGVETQERLCSDSECQAPIDGHWERWSGWSSCSKSCGSGIMFRSRKCEDPAPKNGGKNCSSEDSQSTACNNFKCLGVNDCSFELNLCDWVASNTPFKWQRFTGATPTSNTGPSFDHSEEMNGQGYYLYTEASGLNQGDVALLTSKNYPASVGDCFSFWYHMYGSGIGSLLVFLVKNNSQKEKILLKMINGNQGNVWKSSDVTIRSDVDYQIIIQAIRGNSFLSDIAIDDIRLTSKTVCATDDFQSLSGTQKLGCYKSSTKPFNSLKNIRNNIDWYNIGMVVEQCADFSKQQNSTYFGIQFYGECWYHLKNDASFKSGETSNDCFQYLVGKETSIMVYKLL